MVFTSWISGALVAGGWFSAVRRLNFFNPISIRMSFFKKIKKSRQPSRQPMSLGIPTSIAVGALGIGADLDLSAGHGGVFRSMRSMNGLARLTAAAGENNERGSRIVLQNNSEAQRPSPSGALTPARERGDDIKRRSILLQLIAPILMISTAVHEIRGRKDPSDTHEEQLGHIVPNLSFTTPGESGVHDQRGKGGKGTVVEQIPEALVEHVSGGQYAFRGERCCPW